MIVDIKAFRNSYKKYKNLNVIEEFSCFKTLSLR